MLRDFFIISKRLKCKLSERQIETQETKWHLMPLVLTSPIPKHMTLNQGGGGKVSLRKILIQSSLPV